MIGREGIVVALACALAFLAPLAGCGPRGGGTEMVVEPPPEGWADGIVAERAERDRDFREAPDSPIPPDRRATFDGLDYWPPDPDYRFVGEIHEYPSGEPFEVVTTTGKVRPCVRYGWLTFRVEGKRLNLQIYKMLDGLDTDDPMQALFLPFTDSTTGDETYPAGRYVDLVRDAAGQVVLDFNRAYNPLCAYGMPERYACPVTPPENRLPVRIESGERGYAREP